jgi:SpoVK/Ycf46/Vps4 family AAA+-type ATPase
VEISELAGAVRAALQRPTGAAPEAAAPSVRDAASAPWRRLCERFALTDTEELALAVVALVELDPSARTLMRTRSDETRVWPDVGLLADCVYLGEARQRLLYEMAPEGTLLRHRLLEGVGSPRQIEDAPFVARPLRTSRRVLELVNGAWRLDPEVAGFASLVEQRHDGLRLPPGLREQVSELVRMACERGRPGPLIVLAGREGVGRAALIEAIAAERGMRVLRVRCADLGQDTRDAVRAMQAAAREARLFDAVLLLDGLDELLGDPETSRNDRLRAVDQAVLSSYAGPIAATAGPPGKRPLRFGHGSVVIDVPMPTEPDAVTLWHRALDSEEVSARAAARYQLSPGLLSLAAVSAREQARASDRGITLDDVHAGVRSVLDGKLSTLGIRVTWQQTWSDVVLPDDIVDEVREFVGRVRHKRRVFDDWGYARKVARGLGLSALFSGPPGTGKTMIAGIIAAELGLDLYQIDLARVVSKYVGETEKNLSQVFDAAEAGHSILLFDEADSLFAKRTDVNSSVDRYANLEVNYLLQRIEAFRGITILTTNNDAAIDDAFRRRLSLRIDFPLPEPDERQRLWRTMIPDEAARATDVDDMLLERLADKYAMSGGYIRNAALRAAFLAAEDGGTIAARHLQRAAALEYAAMGKVMNW